MKIFARASLLAIAGFVGNANAMTFSAPKHEFSDALSWGNRGGGVTRIYADGEITSSTAMDFERFVKANNITSATVLFNSPGGSLFGGIQLGTKIRSFGFDTGIATYSQGRMVERGYCASACAYAFAGGRGRYFSGKETKLGLHQFSAKSTTIDNGTSQETSGLIVAYLQNMGVDALAFSASASVRPEDILWLTAQDAAKLRFSNNGTQLATAELKQAQGATYLKVEQEYTNWNALFLLMCSNGSMALSGGLLTTVEDSKNKFEWATNSYFTFDGTTIQPQRKGATAEGLQHSESIVWVFRELSSAEMRTLLSSKTITAWIAADGAVGYTAVVDISGVKGKIQDYVKNCYDARR